MILSPRARNQAERTYGYSAEFLTSWFYGRTPIFHISGYYAPTNRPGTTACGRRTWDDERQRPIGFWLSPIHAVKFARPCNSCIKACRKAKT